MTHTGLHKLDDLDPSFRAKIDDLLDALTGLQQYVCVVSTRRTIQQQNQLYAQGRTIAGNIVTNAKGGSSPHNFGLAVDLCPLDDAGNLDWNDTKGFQVIGDLAEDMSLIWGGHWKFKDLPHIESPRFREVQAQWRRGEIQIA